MRPTTGIFAKFESKGKPEFTRNVDGTVQRVVTELAKWMMECHMGTHIRITFARSALELEQHTNSKFDPIADSDLMADLDAIMNQDILPLNGE